MAINSIWKLFEKRQKSHGYFFFTSFHHSQLGNYIIWGSKISLTTSVCFPDRGTCVHRGDQCRGACSGSHVAGDGEDHHQAHVWFPEELHVRWRLWMCSGGIRVGPPGPKSWAGMSVRRPSRRFSTHTFPFTGSGSLDNAYSALS